MKFSVLTLFPEMFDCLNQSIIGRAEEKNLINIKIINMRDFSKDKHKKVDDTPYGGGAGMVMKADVVYDAFKSSYNVIPGLARLQKPGVHSVHDTLLLRGKLHIIVIKTAQIVIVIGGCIHHPSLKGNLDGDHEFFTGHPLPGPVSPHDAAHIGRAVIRDRP